jgi:hypothetical protein
MNKFENTVLNIFDCNCSKLRNYVSYYVKKQDYSIKIKKKLRMVTFLKQKND